MKALVRRTLALILIVAFVCTSSSPVFAARHRKRSGGVYGITAVSGLLWDANSGHYYYAKNVDAKIFPASTTKVLTVLLALEHLNLDQYVTVSQAATQVQETKLNLRPGEQYKVRDLLYAALLKSANDAAVVLAEAVAGSQSKFVDMMNARAFEIGARHTRFANAHGLPSDGTQYTTAHDMALIFKEALKQPFFKQAITFKYYIIYSKDGRRFFLKSHNKSLFLNWHNEIYGKTGYTREAQSCFVGYATKGNNVFIIAVFGCSKRWEDIKFIIERYGKIDL